MAPWEGAAGLPAALFLFHVPGCLALSGPDTVMGTVGGSLTVQCHYEEEFKELNKYWYREPFLLTCDKIVETKKSEREMRHGRVSIRDRHANLAFAVTMGNLTEDDGGQYWCGVDTPWLRGLQGIRPDPVVEIVVTVLPASSATSNPKSSTRTPDSRTSLPAPTGPRTIEQEPPSTSQYMRSLLSSVHFLLLVFLEVPLLLGMLSAVFWVNWPQRGS